MDHHHRALSVSIFSKEEAFITFYISDECHAQFGFKMKFDSSLHVTTKL